MELALGVDNGNPAYPAVPDLPGPSTIGKTGPGPTCWTQRTTRNRGPEPVKQVTVPGRCSHLRDPPAWAVPRSGLRVNQGTALPSDSDRPPPWRPGSQSDADAARRHGSRSREARVPGTRGYPRGQLPHTDYPARTPSFPDLPEFDAQGLSMRAGDYHPSSAASGRRPRDRPNAWNNDSEGCRTQATRILPTALLPGDGPAREVPSWFRH